MAVEEVLKSETLYKILLYSLKDTNDDSINKCELWNGTAWVNMDGTALT